MKSLGNGSGAENYSRSPLTVKSGTRGPGITFRTEITNAGSSPFSFSARFNSFSSSRMQRKHCPNNIVRFPHMQETECSHISRLALSTQDDQTTSSIPFNTEALTDAANSVISSLLGVHGGTIARSGKSETGQGSRRSGYASSSSSVPGFAVPSRGLSATKSFKEPQALSISRPSSDLTFRASSKFSTAVGLARTATTAPPWPSPITKVSWWKAMSLKTFTALVKKSYRVELPSFLPVSFAFPYHSEARAGLYGHPSFLQTSRAKRRIKPEVIVIRSDGLQ